MNQRSEFFTVPDFLQEKMYEADYLLGVQTQLDTLAKHYRGEALVSMASALAEDVNPETLAAMCRQAERKQTGTLLASDPIPSFTMADLLSRELPETIWLLDEMIPEQGLFILSGQTGAGKTWAAIELGLSVSNGIPTWGGLMAPPGKVLYLGADASERTFHIRAHEMANGYGIEPNEKFVIDLATDPIDTEAGIEKLRQKIEHHRPTLVIVDVLLTYLAEHDFKEGRGMSRVFARLRGIANEYECCIGFLHHANKDDSNGWLSQVGGAVQIPAGMDSVFILSQDDRPDAPRVIKHTKSRDGLEVDPLEFRLLAGSNETGVRLQWEEHKSRKRSNQILAVQLLTKEAQRNPGGVEWNRETVAGILKPAYLPQTGEWMRKKLEPLLEQSPGWTVIRPGGAQPNIYKFSPEELEPLRPQSSS